MSLVINNLNIDRNILDYWNVMPILKWLYINLFWIHNQREMTNITYSVSSVVAISCWVRTLKYVYVLVFNQYDSWPTLADTHQTITPHPFSFHYADVKLPLCRNCKCFNKEINHISNICMKLLNSWKQILPLYAGWTAASHWHCKQG